MIEVLDLAVARRALGTRATAGRMAAFLRGELEAA